MTAPACQRNAWVHSINAGPNSPVRLHPTSELKLRPLKRRMIECRAEGRGATFTPKAVIAAASTGGPGRSPVRPELLLATPFRELTSDFFGPGVFDFVVDGQALFGMGNGFGLFA